jgi:hypothetical protein
MTGRGPLSLRARIGLALERAVCDTIGLTVSAENSADGSVAFALRMRVLATQAAERPA